jgi:hypothetical protein
MIQGRLFQQLRLRVLRRIVTQALRAGRPKPLYFMALSGYDQTGASFVTWI